MNLRLPAKWRSSRISLRKRRKSELLRSTRTIKRNRNDLFDRAGPLRQDDDAVAHVNGFIDVVSNEEHGSAPVLPKAQDFILHTHAGEGVEGAEWLVEQKNFGMINQGASQSYRAAPFRQKGDADKRRRRLPSRRGA